MLLPRQSDGQNCHIANTVLPYRNKQKRIKQTNGRENSVDRSKCECVDDPRFTGCYSSRQGQTMAHALIGSLNCLLQNAEFSFITPLLLCFWLPVFVTIGLFVLNLNTTHVH